MVMGQSIQSLVVARFNGDKKRRKFSIKFQLIKFKFVKLKLFKAKNNFEGILEAILRILFLKKMN